MTGTVNDLADKKFVTDAQDKDTAAFAILEPLQS
jgi:hypothetical protein